MAPSEKIFINYRRSDSAGTAGRLFDQLVGEFGRQQVFMDIDDLRGGQEYAMILQREVRDCQLCLVVIGSRWLDAASEDGRRRLDAQTDLVRIEIETALRAGKWVIPVLVDGGRMPGQSDLPPSLRAIADLHGVQVRNEFFQSDFTRLADDIRAAFAETEKARQNQGVMTFDALISASPQDAEYVARIRESLEALGFALSTAAQSEPEAVREAVRTAWTVLVFLGEDWDDTPQEVVVRTAAEIKKPIIPVMLREPRGRESCFVAGRPLTGARLRTIAMAVRRALALVATPSAIPEARPRHWDASRLPSEVSEVAELIVVPELFPRDGFSGPPTAAGAYGGVDVYGPVFCAHETDSVAGGGVAGATAGAKIGAVIGSMFLPGLGAAIGAALGAAAGGFGGKSVAEELRRAEQDKQTQQLLEAIAERVAFLDERLRQSIPKLELPRTSPPVHAAASGPRSVRSGEEFTANFWLHTADCPPSPPDGNEIASHPLGSLEPETRLRLTARGEGLTVEPDAVEIIWKGQTLQTIFDVWAHNASARRQTRLKFDLSVEGVVLARIRLDIQIEAWWRRYVPLWPSVPTQVRRALLPKTAFVSYARDDIDRVFDRVASLRIFGVDVFVDCFSLAPSEEWWTRLTSEIESRELFVLFWSEAAAASDFVRREWRHRRSKRGYDGFQIHPLEYVSLPKELAHLHGDDSMMSVRQSVARTRMMS